MKWILLELVASLSMVCCASMGHHVRNARTTAMYTGWALFVNWMLLWVFYNI